MSYFTDDFVSFFKDLAANNHKDWFHANKKRYEQSVKKPFEAFLRDLIAEIQKHDPSVQVEPKHCMGRINRDIRFSKDKTPYNTHYTAFVSRVGKKDKSIPGIYLRFTPEDIGVLGGSYGLDKDHLYNVRQAISNQLQTFQKLIKAKDFVNTFGEVRGEDNKRIPPEFKATFEKEPLIAKKSFYYVSTLNVNMITSDQLLEEIMRIWHVAQPMNKFLDKAMG